MNILGKINENKIFIFLFTISGLVIFGLSYILVIVFSSPIEMANDYGMTHRELDANYNKMVKSEKLFDQKYKVILPNERNLKEAGNTVMLRVEDLSGNAVKDVNISAVVTRPDTTRYDIVLPRFKLQSEWYQSIGFDLEKKGRWQVNYKIELENLTKYIQIEYYIKIEH